MPHGPSAIAAHSTTKPTRTKELKDMTAKEYAAWSSALSVWLWEMEALEAREMVKGMKEDPLTRRDRIMGGKACTPRADYNYREPVKRKRQKRATWAGATREYNRTKQAERTARVREAVLEVQRERDGAKHG